MIAKISSVSTLWLNGGVVMTDGLERSSSLFAERFQ